MKLRFRFAAALLAAALVAGCGGAQPESAGSVVNAPAAPAQDKPSATAPDTPVSSTPVPNPDAKSAPTAPAAPTTTAPSAPSATPPTNPTTAAPVTAPEPARSLAFTSVQKGTHSGVTERKAVLLTDEAGWQANWQQLSATVVPAPPAPAMDFSQQSVLAVYMGEKKSGGYAIEITGVELSDGTLKVTVKETRPGPGTMVTMALTQPYHMVRIPKVPAGTRVEVNW